LETNVEPEPISVEHLELIILCLIAGGAIARPPGEMAIADLRLACREAANATEACSIVQRWIRERIAGGVLR
jgi:hypothetical protein